MQKQLTLLESKSTTEIVQELKNDFHKAKLEYDELEDAMDELQEDITNLTQDLDTKSAVVKGFKVSLGDYGFLKGHAMVLAKELTKAKQDLEASEQNIQKRTFEERQLLQQIELLEGKVLKLEDNAKAKDWTRQYATQQSFENAIDMSLVPDFQTFKLDLSEEITVTPKNNNTLASLLQEAVVQRLSHIQSFERRRSTLQAFNTTSATAGAGLGESDAGKTLAEKIAEDVNEEKCESEEDSSDDY